MAAAGGSRTTEDEIVRDWKEFFRSRGREAELMDMSENLQVLIPIADRSLSVTLRGTDMNINKIRASFYSKRILSPQFFKRIIESVLENKRHRLLTLILAEVPNPVISEREDILKFNYSNFFSVVILLLPYSNIDNLDSLIRTLITPAGMRDSLITPEIAEIIFDRILQLIPTYIDQEDPEDPQEILFQIVASTLMDVNEPELMRKYFQLLDNYPVKRAIVVEYLAVEGVMMLAKGEMINFLAGELHLNLIDAQKINMQEHFIEGIIGPSGIKEMVLYYDPGNVIINRFIQDINEINQIEDEEEKERRVAFTYLGQSLQHGIDVEFFRLLRERGADYFPVLAYRGIRKRLNDADYIIPPPDEEIAIALGKIYEIMTPEQRAVIDEEGMAMDF